MVVASDMKATLQDIAGLEAPAMTFGLEVVDELNVVVVEVVVGVGGVLLEVLIGVGLGGVHGSHGGLVVVGSTEHSPDPSHPLPSSS